MELYNNLCKSCGGDLRQLGEEQYKCDYCSCVYDSKAVEQYADDLHRLLDELKIEAVSNARRNLYEAISAEYISSTRVHECCVILKQLLPDDFQASFYEVATGNNLGEIAKAIRAIDAKENFNYLEGIIRYLLQSLKTEYALELNDLIARAYEKNDPEKFEKYCTLLAAEAVKVDGGVYETRLPREVFVAYSSKDMEKVQELTAYLESQGLRCFVAARNLRHGKGSVENYNSALEEAMDSCRSVVFVSSMHSRSFNCDALTVELPYVKKRDVENAPAEYKNNYKAIPQIYKKPRVEYCIGERSAGNAADVISNEIFDGYERVYSPEAVAARVMQQLVEAPIAAKEGSCIPQGGSAAEPQRATAEVGSTFAPTPVSIQTGERESTGLMFALTSGGHGYAVANLYVCRDTRIVIPTSYKGKPVTEIGEKAFLNAGALTEVVIPRGVEHIGASAFEGCSHLSKVTLPETLKTVGKAAFYHCPMLTSVRIPTGVTAIGSNAFASCQKLETVTLPNTLTDIGEWAFYKCDKLATVSIPQSVTHIGASAFRNCASITSIILPAGIERIEDSAFRACTALASVSMPSSVTMIRANAFADCTALKSVTVPASVEVISENALPATLAELVFESPTGWEKANGGLLAKISPKVLADPQKAADAFRKTYCKITVHHT